MPHIMPAAAQSSAPPARPTSAEVERRVESLLRHMTLEEKIDLLGGVNLFDVRGISRLGVPVLRTADGPFGVRAGGRSNVMAGGIALAATWNVALAERVGAEIGRDARARGKHFHLAPGVNIYRAPMNGRNFEYYGEDPFLASRIAVGYIRGVQAQGVASTIKHFLGNNSEFGRHIIDAVIDERTLREIYLPAFEAAVREAQVGAIMAAYNLVNGEHMTQNRRLNVDLVKQEWGFPGIIMSDWNATHDARASADGGLDLEMPAGTFLNRAHLVPLIQQGTIAQATIDDKVRRILRTAVRFGWLDRPQLDTSIPRYNPHGREVALQTAREAIVLLKNDGPLLPLNRQTIRSLAVIGPNAHPAVPIGGGSATVPPFRTVSVLEGLSTYLGTAADVHYARGIPSLSEVVHATNFSTAPTQGQPGLRVEVFNNADLAGEPASRRTDRRVSLGTPLDVVALVTGEMELDVASLAAPKPISTRWTGYYVPPQAGTYDIVVQQGGFSPSGYRLFVDGQPIADRWQMSTAVVEVAAVTLDASPHQVVLEHHSETGLGSPFIRMGIVRQGGWVDTAAEELAAKADVVVLAVGFDPASETEGWDRTFGLPPGQDELIQKLTAVNTHTILVVTAGGAVDMHAWVDRVPGLVQVWYPGQEGGTALADILFGDVNPSGRLPVTLERRWEDNPTYDSYYPEAGTNRVVYKEGVFVGYRGYEHRGAKPLFPFGYGLSYTTFTYSHLSVTPLTGGTSPGPPYAVSFDVKNTGSRDGADVAQVYVGDRHAQVPRPAKELKGFVKVQLRPGEAKRVSVTLDERALSYYDADAKQWRIGPGDFDVLVGRSSEQIELRGMLRVGTAAPPTRQ
jgi:beta-glucosidase